MIQQPYGHAQGGDYAEAMTSIRWRWPGARRPVPTASPEEPSSPDVDPSEISLSGLLSEMEAAARAVYARHGLPVEPGHYALSAKTGDWRYLADALTAEERWALVLAQKPGTGWRFGTLPSLADQEDSPPEVQLAARVLKACDQIRACVRGGASAADLEMAIRLGADGLELEREQAAPPPKPRRKKTVQSRSRTKPQP